MPDFLPDQQQLGGVGVGGGLRAKAGQGLGWMVKSSFGPTHGGASQLSLDGSSLPLKGGGNNHTPGGAGAEGLWREQPRGHSCLSRVPARSRGAELCVRCDPVPGAPARSSISQGLGGQCAQGRPGAMPQVLAKGTRSGATYCWPWLLVCGGGHGPLTPPAGGVRTGPVTAPAQRPWAPDMEPLLSGQSGGTGCRACAGKPSHPCQPFPGARNPSSAGSGAASLVGHQPISQQEREEDGARAQRLPRRGTQDGSTEAAGPGLGPALLDGAGGAWGLCASGEQTAGPRPT